MKVAQFTVSRVSVLGALEILNNECGLVFGYADTGTLNRLPKRVSLDVRDMTVKDIVDRIARQSPDYSFDTRDGVVVVTPAETAHRRPAFLSLTVPSFVAKGLGPAELKDKLVSLLEKLPGMPPLMWMRSWDSDKPRVDVDVQGQPLSALLVKVCEAISESWVMLDLPSLKRASFGMGRKFGLDQGAKFTVKLAPDTPRRPIPGEAPPAQLVVKEANSRITKARLALHDTDTAVAALAELLDDPQARWDAPGQVADAIQLLGAFRSEDAVPALVRNITAAGPGTFQRSLKDWLQHAGGSQGAQALARETRAAFEVWLNSFPALQALQHIGTPAVPFLVKALGDQEPPVAATTAPGLMIEPPTAEQKSQDNKVRTVLICRALADILGPEAAVKRLRKAVAGEKDSQRSQRLKQAADHLAQGLTPSLLQP